MMNHQVKNYFRTRKLHSICELIREAYLDLTPQPEGPILYLACEGVGEGVRIPITNDDVDFIHQVQFLYKKQGNPGDSSPQGWKVLATKYALLHPAPLHNYVAKWDDADGRLKIYETRRIGGSTRTEDHFVAEVGPEMYDFYAKAHNKKFNAKSNQIEGMTHSREVDEQIAKWWMEENKDCLHNYGKGIPSPQIKILRRGSSSVSLAFRHNTKEKLGSNWKYQWYPVENIPINMNQFRSKVKESGFDELMHSGSILRTTAKKWQSIMEPEKVGKGGGTLNPALEPTGEEWGNVPRPKVKDMDIRPAKGWTVAQIKKLITDKQAELKLDDEGKGDVLYDGKKIARVYMPGFLTPGHQEAEENQSPEFRRLYDQDAEFRSYVENEIAKAVQVALPLLSKGNIRATITYNPQESDPEKIYRVFIPKLYQARGASEPTIRDILQETRRRLMGRTSRVPSEDWKNWSDLKTSSLGDWIRRVAAGSARSAIKQAFAMNKKDAGALVAQGAGGDHEEERPRQGDIGDQQAINRAYSPREDKPDETEMRTLISAALRNPVLLRSRPEIVEKIKALIADDPAIGELLASQGININQLSQQASQHQQSQGEDDPYAGVTHYSQLLGQDDDDQDLDDDDDEYRPGTRYNQPTTRQQQQEPARHEDYSFRNYLNKRFNEMGVVWGNDPASAKKLKRGQTLKGGIQVQGAPWTASGGPNHKDNDIKIT